MAIRIRVHPQGAGAYGAYGAAGAYGPGNMQYFQEKLDNEKRTSNLRLSYERALWQERLKLTQLQGQLSAGVVGAGYPAALGGAYGMAGGMIPGMLPGGLPGGFGMAPGLGMPIMGGSGQTNVTNQSAAGAGNQSVTNSNTYSNYVMGGNTTFGTGFPFGGYGGYGGYGAGWGGHGSGGFLSSLLGALI